MSEPSGFVAMSSILRLHQSMTAVLDHELKVGFRLRLIEFQVLKALESRDAGTHLLGDVARQLLVHATTVTIAVDRLEARGLLTRGPHPRDRRATVVAITDDGRALADAATGALDAVNFGLTGLTAAEWQTLIATVSRVRG